MRWVAPHAAKVTRTHLDIPRPLPETLEAELVGDLRGVHGVGQILLVSEDKEESVPELVLVQHPLELLSCLGNTFPVIRVDDEDDALGILEVCRWRDGSEIMSRLEGGYGEMMGKRRRRTVPPEGTDLVLSSNIPHGERDVLVLDGLNVEACVAVRGRVKSGT